MNNTIINQRVWDAINKYDRIFYKFHNSTDRFHSELIVKLTILQLYNRSTDMYNLSEDNKITPIESKFIFNKVNDPDIIVNILNQLYIDLGIV